MFEKPGVVGPASKFFAGLQTVYEHPDAYDRFSVEGNAGLVLSSSRGTQSVSAEARVEYSRHHRLLPSGRAAPSDRQRSAAICLRQPRQQARTRPRASGLLAYAEPAYDLLTGATFVKFRGEAIGLQALDDAPAIRASPAAWSSARSSARRPGGCSGRPALLCRRRRIGARLCLSGHRPEGRRRQADRRPVLVEDVGRNARRGHATRSASCPSSMPARCRRTNSPSSPSFKVGAGVGLRYLTPFGPLRVDAAVPLNPDPAIRISASMPASARRSEPMRLVKLLLRIIRYTVLVALAFVVGAVAVLTLTERGRDNLAGLISDLASSPGQEVKDQRHQRHLVGQSGAAKSGAGGRGRALAGGAQRRASTGRRSALFAKTFQRRPRLCRADRTGAAAEAGKRAEGGGGLLLAAGFDRRQAIDLPDIALGPALGRRRGVGGGEGLGAGARPRRSDRVGAQHRAQRRPCRQIDADDRLRARRRTGWTSTSARPSRQAASSPIS